VLQWHVTSPPNTSSSLSERTSKIELDSASMAERGPEPKGEKSL
jgi:hypothetical protein